MQKAFIEQLAADWHRWQVRFPAPVTQRVRALAEQHRETLADHFYKEMLQDPVASRIISHDQVKTRLHGSMMNWLVQVFSAGAEADAQALVARQMQIGEVHARIDVPVHLVLQGARSLKREFYNLLENDPVLDAVGRFEAARLVACLIDMAMEIMSYAYANSHDRNSRAAEAYRLFSVVQNVSAERQRQRAALLDWENRLMFELAVGHRCRPVAAYRCGRIRPVVSP